MKINLKISYFLTIFLLIYSLFAFSSIKTMYAPIVDGIKGNNVIYFVFFVFVFRLFLIKKIKSNFKVFIFIFLILIYLLITIIFKNNSQSIYSLLLMIMPIFLVSTSNEYDGKLFVNFLKVITILSLVYSIFVCFEFFAYDFFSNHFSLNPVASYDTRHSTMLGTSITTSYYFILNIPFEVIAYKMLDNRWKKILFVSIALNVLAIILNQSRICFITLFIYLLFYFFSFNKNVKIHYKVLIVIFSLILMIWILNNNNLSRLYTNYGESVSTETRFEVLKIGLDEFYKYPFFGSGISTYYKRLWNVGTRFVYIHNTLSLIDPHNLFIYILVEQGLFGFVLFIMLFSLLRKEYYNYLPDFIKDNLKILMIGLLVIFCGGSHLINEINYSVIFWIYFMFIFSYSIYKRKEMID